MRAFRICGCWLLVVPLLGTIGCSRSGYVKQANTVKVCACKAHPDTVEVHETDTLTWNIDPSDTHHYLIKFTGRTPVSAPTVSPGESKDVTRDAWCIVAGWISTNACVYGYDLIQDPSTNNPTRCKDPGVHIVH